ncbi:capsid maturation protease [Stenotrophomonas phage Silvanus]|nr:capsid maturation protease [Stenotrophomonas phage Silvanus]
MAMKYLDRPFEVKDKDEKTGRFTGYGSVFGEVDSYRDIVMPGAFKNTLARFKQLGRKVPMLWQHNSRQPMGVYDVLKEDKHGLYVEGAINMKTQVGVEGFALMDQGALSGLSIGYETVMFKDDNEKLVRELHELDLWEISPVTFPAGDTARIQTVKSWDQLTTLRDCEEALQNTFGLSGREASKMIHAIKAAALKPQGEPAQKKAAVPYDLIEQIRNFSL